MNKGIGGESVRAEMPTRVPKHLMAMESIQGLRSSISALERLADDLIGGVPGPACDGNVEKQHQICLAQFMDELPGAIAEMQDNINQQRARIEEVLGL